MEEKNDQKIVCRQAKHKSQKAKLQVHFDIYKDRLHIHKITTKKGKTVLSFSEIINKNNAHYLFILVDRLINPSPSVPPELLSNKSHSFFH